MLLEGLEYPAIALKGVDQITASCLGQSFSNRLSTYRCNRSLHSEHGPVISNSSETWKLPPEPDQPSWIMKESILEPVEGGSIGLR